MKQHHQTIGWAKLCRLFGKSRQAYYDHLWRHSDENMQEALIIELVRARRVYLPRVGGNKLLGMLKEEFSSHHITIGRDRFFRLLSQHGLLIKHKKKYVRTTCSWHHYKKWPNLIENLQINAPEQLWVSDITYLRTENGSIYLSLITDAYSRKIVGYHLSQYLRAQGCITTLNKALASLCIRPSTSLIHHSDRGIQYCCDAYVDILQGNNIQISMTQSGSPYDNAIAERVNGILKTELELDTTFKSYSEAIAAVHQAIDVYNRLRPHMSCGNLTPDLAHQTTGKLTRLWKPKKKTPVKLV
jgi:transposase InsO family protein